jgi:hypothetical protein
MESMRVVLYNSTIPVDSYTYLVYVNCGMTGPAPERAQRWTTVFTKPLSSKICMTGLSINCHATAHVQSFAYALNQKGLSIVKSKGVIFDCLQRNYSDVPESLRDRRRFVEIVKDYERGMSYHIIRVRLGIQSVLPQWKTTVFRKNISQCRAVDPWYVDYLSQYYGGRLPTLEEVFKTSRFLPKAIGELIHYTLLIKKAR